MVSLSATAGAGSAFVGWSGGGCSGAGPCTVTLSSDQLVTATFLGVPSSMSRPAISGPPHAHKKLSCSTGAWTNNPTSFSHRWSRDGTPVAGASRSNYTVSTSDEGMTLTCTVIASNQAGPGSPATSNGVAVPVPSVPGCPKARGRLRGNILGPVKLGMTRAQARNAFSHSSDHSKRFEDLFCLTPHGVRVGYPSTALLATLPAARRKHLQQRVVLALTANAFYALHGIRPGATVVAASRALKIGAPFHIGQNRWYTAPNGSSTAILLVRRGLVQQIGIANSALTSTRSAALAFLSSFS